MLETNYAYAGGKEIGFAKAERLSGYLPSIDADHVHVHNGIVYQNIQSNAALADDGSLLFEIIVSENSFLHFKGLYLWVTDEHWEMTMVGNPTLTTGAATLENLPFRYPTPKATNIIVKSNPTGISGGDNIVTPTYMGGGTGVGQSVSSMALSKSFEHLLSEGTYLLSVTNRSGGEAKVSANIIWYETINGESA